MITWTENIQLKLQIHTSVR